MSEQTLRRRFVYRLALMLGYSDIDLMLRSITARQLAMWESLYQIEPFYGV